MEEYSKFLRGLSQQLSSSDCGDLAFVGGLSGDGGESPVSRGGSCCCHCPRDQPFPCSPGLRVLRGLERIGLFNRGCLGKLAEALKAIGRKDLADKCSAAEFSPESPVPDQESGCGIQENGCGVQESIVADRCASCHHHLRVVTPDREEFISSCPIPSGSARGENSAHSFTSSAIVCSTSSRGPAAPTVTESAWCNIQLEAKNRPEILNRIKRKLTPASRSFPSRSESTSPELFNEDSYFFINPDDIPSPSSIEFISISPSSTSDMPPLATPPLDTPTSTASRDSSPSCDFSICHTKQPSVDTPSSSAGKSSGGQVTRGRSLDLPSSKARPRSFACLRSLTAPKLFARRPFQKFKSDSQTGVSGLEQNGDVNYQPSFTWDISIPNLLSRISKKQTKPLEKKFLARTQADDNKFCLELVLKLCPIGLDFEQDSFCTLTVEVHSKKACNLLSQKVKLHVVGRAGGDCLKEVGKVCVVGESQRVPEFLSHEVLRCSEASHIELQFNLHLQYELDGEEATWEFIGRDFVL